MTIPNVPFSASQALAEYGWGASWMGSLMSAIGIGPPNWLSAFGGRSAYTPMAPTCTSGYANNGPSAYYLVLASGGSYDYPTIQANPNGGVAPYTYSWYWDPPPGLWMNSILYPSNQLTQLQLGGIDIGTYAGWLKCLITDGTGATAICQFYINAEVQ